MLSSCLTPLTYPNSSITPHFCTIITHGWGCRLFRPTTEMIAESMHRWVGEEIDNRKFSPQGILESDVTLHHQQRMST